MPYLDALLKPLISKSNKTAIIIDVLSNTIITLLVRALIVQIWRNNVIILLFSVKSVGWGGSVALSIFFGLFLIPLHGFRSQKSSSTETLTPS